MVSLAAVLRLAVQVSVVLTVGAGFAAAQPQWELVTKTSLDEMSIARDSLLGVSRDIVSIWVQHRGADGSRVAERYEVNCVTQQRRLLEVWSRPDLQNSAPTALRASGWTPTEPNTSMRELVVRVCAIPRREPA